MALPGSSTERAPEAWLRGDPAADRLELHARLLDWAHYGAEGGWLFLCSADGLDLAAPLAGFEPPDHVVAEASRLLATQAGRAAVEPPHTEPIRLCVLSAATARGLVPVGVAALRRAGSTTPDERIRELVARRLYDAGDALTS